MDLRKNILALQEEIIKTANNSGRNPDKIKLLVVTKTHSAEIIDKAIAAGAKYIGENKIQESEEKIPNLKNRYEEFHFIGHLQSNKINKLMPLKPTLIHSIDKISTARKLNNYLEKNQLKQNILIQINTSGETSKFGIEPHELSQFIPEIAKLENLQVQGLMTIGLNSPDENKVRQNFYELKQLFELHKKNSYPNVEMKYLSMGMTNDFKIAIEEGANIIRIGSAIFGERVYK